MAELITRLPRHKTRQMVNANHSQRWPALVDDHGEGRLLERAVLGIHRHGVILAIWVTADVADDAQTAVWHREGLPGYEGRDFGCPKVDAVDENIRCIDLGEWSAGGGLGNIPLDDLGIRDAGLLAEIDCAHATAAARTDDDDSRGILVLSLRFGR